MINDWTHGHPRRGRYILIGSVVHCAGCGLAHGVVTAAIDVDTPVGQRALPNFPFPVGDCPVCQDMPPTLTEIALSGATLAQLRAEIARRKG